MPSKNRFLSKLPDVSSPIEVGSKTKMSSLAPERPGTLKLPFVESSSSAAELTLTPTISSWLEDSWTSPPSKYLDQSPLVSLPKLVGVKTRKSSSLAIAQQQLLPKRVSTTEGIKGEKRTHLVGFPLYSPFSLDPLSQLRMKQFRLSFEEGRGRQNHTLIQQSRLNHHEIAEVSDRDISEVIINNSIIL